MQKKMDLAKDLIQQLEEEAKKYRIVWAVVPLLCGDRYCQRFHPEPGVAIEWDAKAQQFRYYEVLSKYGHGAIADYGYGPGCPPVYECTREEAIRRLAKLLREAGLDKCYWRPAKIRNGWISANYEAWEK